MSEHQGSPSPLAGERLGEGLSVRVGTERGGLTMWFPAVPAAQPYIVMVGYDIVVAIAQPLPLGEGAVPLMTER